jgi:hypothetical protein
MGCGVVWQLRSVMATSVGFCFGPVWQVRLGLVGVVWRGVAK